MGISRANVESNVSPIMSAASINALNSPCYIAAIEFMVILPLLSGFK